VNRVDADGVAPVLGHRRRVELGGDLDVTAQVVEQLLSDGAERGLVEFSGGQAEAAGHGVEGPGFGAQRAGQGVQVEHPPVPPLAAGEVADTGVQSVASGSDAAGADAGDAAGPAALVGDVGEAEDPSALEWASARGPAFREAAGVEGQVERGQRRTGYRGLHEDVEHEGASR
jgi:hypothetical protein